jgi:hypothetical protein
VKKANERSVIALELLRIVSRVAPLAIGRSLLLQVQEPRNLEFVQCLNRYFKICRVIRPINQLSALVKKNVVRLPIR